MEIERTIMKEELNKKERLILSGSTIPSDSMEVDQLRRNNATLVQTLKTFRDAERFTNFIDDSGGQVSKLTFKKTKILNEDVEDELQDMVPGQAF